MNLVIWDIALSAAFGFVGWFVHIMWNELQRILILLSRTREETAKEYVTKQEFYDNNDRIVARLETLNAKLDRIIENRK